MGTMPTPQIDDASPENVKKLERFANAIIEENQFMFDRICDTLVNNRDNNHLKKESWLKSLRKKYFQS